MKQKRLIFWLAALCLALGSLIFTSGSEVVRAQPITEPDPGGEGWLATYWNNTSLSGEPVLVRNETAIDYDLGLGSPALDQVDVDRYSARWERDLRLPEGRYRFSVTVDDGARLWVNGRLFIDAWEIQPENSYTGEIYLPEGNVPIVLEYFENTGVSTIILEWEPVDTFIDRWQGNYYNNKILSGTPALIRDDAAIDFIWGADSPAPDIIDPESFSVRWTRTLDLPAGQYRFTATADDGVRLWVNDQLLIDQWQTQPAATFSRELTLPGGPVPVEMTYFENGGLARAELTWERLHAAPSPEPESTLVDNDSSGFIFGGPAAGWNVEAEGYDSDMRWTRHSSNSEGSYNWGRWYPDLTAGVYEVQAFIPFRFSTTEQARYWVSHANGYELREINQVANSGQWVTLGTFAFEGTSSDFVSLADVTFESEEDGHRLIAYDAVRWLPVNNTDTNATRLTLTPNSGVAGTAVTATASGFPANQPIFLRLGPPNTEPFGQYAQTTTDSTGSAIMTFIVPNSWPNGDPVTTDSLVALAIANDGTSETAVFNLQP